MDILTSLPPGYVPFEEWEEFDLPGTISPRMHPAWVPNTSLGVCWSAWPVTFEQFVSDTEPEVTNEKRRTPLRIIKWQRLTRTEKPAEWIQFSNKSAHLMGFAELRSGEEYWKEWDSHARWDRKQWAKKYLDVSHRIESVPFHEFRAAYKKGALAGWVKHAMLGDLEMRMRVHPQHLRFLAARDLKNNELVAGMAIIDSPTRKASCYHAGFVHKNAGRYPMTGLMDAWFKGSVEKNYQFLHFGGFWQPGESRAKKGFSNFKAKFGVRYLRYPPMLHKFSWT